MRLAAERIESFHRRQLPPAIDYVDALGVRLANRWRPIAAAGLYVPGGTAAYPSSVLMNAIPAKVAGVERLVMTVPAPGGVLNPLVLAAAELVGIDEIYRVGGAQAIAALAFGTATIAPVDKIVGPGNAYVAAAKRRVFGRVGIDMIAGPSEILVVADRRNDPQWIAADLLAQAEHDSAAQAILITDDAAFAAEVEAAVEGHLARLPRAEIAGASWRAHGAIILVDRLGRGGGADRPDRSRAPRAGTRRGRCAGRAGSPCGCDLPRPPHPRGDRRLYCRAQPCIADGAQRALRLRSWRPRLPQAQLARPLRCCEPGGVGPRGDPSRRSGRAGGPRAVAVGPAPA